jgi:hypothetical protein
MSPGQWAGHDPKPTFSNLNELPDTGSDKIVGVRPTREAAARAAEPAILAAMLAIALPGAGAADLVVW